VKSRMYVREIKIRAENNSEDDNGKVIFCRVCTCARARARALAKSLYSSVYSLRSLVAFPLADKCERFYIRVTS